MVAQILDTGYWILDTRYWILDTGYWLWLNQLVGNLCLLPPRHSDIQREGQETGGKEVQLEVI